MSKLNKDIVETMATSIPRLQIFMNAHFPGLVLELKNGWVGV